MIKIYYADLYCHKARAQVRRDQLNTIPGVKVVSTWMDEKHGATVQVKDLSVEEHVRYGTRDLDEICECDVLVLCQPEGDLHDYNITNLSRGGRHFEAGYAFALKKQVVVIGQRENIFHWQPKVKQFDTWLEFLAYLNYCRMYVEATAWENEGGRPYPDLCQEFEGRH